MLTSWFWEQKQAYWLVSVEIYQEAIKQNNQISFMEAIPLFHGDSFKDIQGFTPWIIPIQPALHNVDQTTFEQGFVWISDVSIWDVVSHLRSLLHASLNGEEVMFRFYDPKVLASMLNTFSPDEINAWLGNIKSMAIIENGVFQIYSNTSKREYKPKKVTWWKILPHHLVPFYQTQHHAYSIERRLWEKLPNMLERIPSINTTILSLLQKAIDKGLNSDEAESVVLASLAQQTKTEHSILSASLMLNDDEMKELRKMEEVMASWE